MHRFQGDPRRAEDADRATWRSAARPFADFEEAPAVSNDARVAADDSWKSSERDLRPALPAARADADAQDGDVASPSRCLVRQPDQSAGAGAAKPAGDLMRKSWEIQPRDNFQSYTSPPPHAGAGDFKTPWDKDVKDWQPTRGLSEQQKTAIDLMLRGMKLEKIAEQLGIHRGTLWRWRRFDELFRTALAFGRAKAYQHATEQLRELVPRAVHIIQSQLEGDDHRAAFQLLRLVNIGRDATDTL